MGIYFPDLKSWVAEVLVSHQKQLLTPACFQQTKLKASTDTAGENPSTSGIVQPATSSEQSDMPEQVIYKILQAATMNPNEVI